MDCGNNEQMASIPDAKQEYSNTNPKGKRSSETVAIMHNTVLAIPGTSFWKQPSHHFCLSAELARKEPSSQI